MEHVFILFQTQIHTKKLIQEIRDNESVRRMKAVGSRLASPAIDSKNNQSVGNIVYGFYPLNSQPQQILFH